MENSNDTTRNRTLYLPACSAVPQPTAPPRTGEKNITCFSAQIYLINVANLMRFCNETLTVVIATARRCSTSKLHVGTDCLQQIGVMDVIRPFVLLLRHNYCLLQNIKSIRDPEMWKIKNWNARSFI